MGKNVSHFVKLAETGFRARAGKGARLPQVESAFFITANLHLKGKPSEVLGTGHFQPQSPTVSQRKLPVCA